MIIFYLCVKYGQRGGVNRWDMSKSKYTTYIVINVAYYIVIRKEKNMAKTVGTTHNVLKVFGIKVFDYYSDYICNETIEDIETLKDDIILHENREKK